MLGMCHCIPMVLVSHRVSYMVCRSAFVVIVILVLFYALMHTFFSHFHLLPVSRVPVVQSRFSLANYMYV